MKVRVLEDHVANQIAAGEVIERPASIVRELVDNAVDAGSTDITIALEDGGKRLIRVSDNGSGMERDDAILAFERHATSKIQSATDLDSLVTLGFRGEALPSIAAVSRVRLRTKTSQADIGTEIIIEGGKLRNVAECSLSSGSDIEIRNLFFNTPARKKFLHSSSTEGSKVRAWLIHSSLSRPHIRYRLISDGRELVNLARKENMMSRAKGVFRGATVSIDSHKGPVAVTGIVSHPAMAQADTSGFVILVNARLVSDRSVMRAVREGFDSTLKDREFPVGFVSIELSPAEVDVNVHPQKSEVRFRNQREVFAAVRDAVAEGVKGFVAPFKTSYFQASATPAASGAREVLSYAQPFPFKSQSKFGSQVYEHSGSAALAVEQADFSQPTSSEPFRFSNLRYIGQALLCYLFCEYQDQVYVVDMHAAHERYNFNLIRKRFSERSVASQRALVPVVVELTPDGFDRVSAKREMLESFGFELEPFGECSVAIRAFPAVLKEPSLPMLVKEFASVDFEDESLGGLKERVDHVAARLACHASVRSGEGLTRDEVYALFEALDSTEFSAACPHGRPVIVSFSADEVEQWFGRDR